MYLAILCNSTAIEMYSDMNQISHGFEGCQMLEYIAEIVLHALENGTEDITNFHVL